MPEAIAITITDLHLTLQQPACRADKSWLNVQSGYLHQVNNLTKELGGVEVLCSGDLFDRWNPSPELINFALEHLPTGMICVPGQHDLPEHRIEAMDRSGYGVLVKAKKIRDISDSSTGNMGRWVCYGSGWDQQIQEPRTSPNRMLSVLLIHRYLWTNGKGYPDAPESNHVSNCKAFKDYDVVVSGDNHTYFTSLLYDSCTVFNGGTFIRRKSDERLHKPCVGIIYSDGTVKRHLLDTSKDLFQEEAEDRKEVPLDMKAFIDNLEKLGEQGVDFREAVKQHLEKEELPEQTKQIILSAIE